MRLPAWGPVVSQHRGHGKQRCTILVTISFAICPADKGFVISLYNRMVCLPAISVLVASTTALHCPCPTGTTGPQEAQLPLWGPRFSRHLLPQHHSQEPRFDLGFKKAAEPPTECGMRLPLRGASDTGGDRV